MQSTLNQSHVLQFLRDSLQAYAVSQFPEYRPGKHHKLLAAKLEEVEAGTLKRLVVLMPPRHGKSKLASELFPAWCLGRNPKKRILSLSYGQDLADVLGRSCRNYMGSAVHAGLFPNSQLAKDSNSLRRFNTNQGGGYSSIGVGGSITGRGADLLVLDDLIKSRAESDSPLYRQNLIDWYKAVARTRLQPDGAIIVIQTRWGVNDFVSWLLNETAHEGWQVVCLPAIALENDVLGRQPGEALWPEAYPLEALEETRATLGSRDWASLYQQCPRADSDVIFEPRWFRHFPQAPKEIAFSDFICSNDSSVWNQRPPLIHVWDLTFGSQKAGSSWTCGQVWTRIDGKKYLLHQVREQASFSDSLELIRQLATDWPPQEILIENRANGAAALDVLKRESYRVRGVEPVGSKSDRAYQVVPQFERGEVWFPQKSTSWLQPLLRELEGFPLSATDDAVDCMTMALSYLATRPRSLVQGVARWG